MEAQAPEAMYQTCPACSSPERYTDPSTGVHVCSGCRAIYGVVSATLYRAYVRPQWAKEPVPPQYVRYFDFMVEGIRTHGWQDRRDGKIVQMG